ncbi:hypothetical protein K9U39_10960 [Rhodoblastus acidophilus]|uniref:Uncharacterized protein n=1 Tax=Candidatus Rhodoblastus alkanivorans TaxID=2954117 RepID=A0ABS9Z973_9HYPH|nr:hypothetical protein [Candidatus Rhodoblastus alkanivorans]MCI4680174.1 hypothetical protein [Candidatus Rhodoblastus alkanivorans]MCI4684131.1 hypothetical protein [Candidatus Rhodoblastus alkanivorans]MDI4641451.1 hypothetical protein [Rhodoblastus acidophilus]
MSGEAWTDALESELTFSRIVARHEYWRDNPPPSAMLMAIAAGLGVWEPTRRATADSVATLRGLFPSGQI